MAKAPVPAHVKTRLIPVLGALGAAQLAQHMLRHTLGTALAAQLGPVELCAAPSRLDPAWQSLALPEAIVWSAQGEGDLGARMARAAQRTIDQQEAVILIGTDCPAIDVATLHAAANALLEAQVSMVPTFDGGYALLGLRQFHANVFNDMTWSTSTVAAETLKRVEKLGWQANLLPFMHDIDEPADMRWLPKAWGYAENTLLQRDALVP